MKRVMEWANVVFAGFSGVGNPQTDETVAGALTRLIRTRRPPTLNATPLEASPHRSSAQPSLAQIARRSANGPDSP